MLQGGLAQVVSHIFGLDVRSLALYRMGLASTMLYVLSVRATDVEALYSDNGLVTREAAIRFSEGALWNMSIHMLSGHATIIAAIFALHFAALVSMFLGYKTYKAAILCWLLEVSLDNRNNAVLQGGDVLCRCLHLYAIFLPLGHVWSVDAWLQKRSVVEPPSLPSCTQRLAYFFGATSPPSSLSKNMNGTVYSGRNLVCSMGTAAVILQVCVLYFFAGLNKLGNRSWTNDFDAIELSLHTDEFTTYMGKYLRSALPQSALGVLTRFSLTLELWCPVLVLFPLSACNRRAGYTCRQCVIALFFAFHIGIRVSLDIGHFSSASMCLWTLLIPGEFYERKRAETSLDCSGLDPVTDKDSRPTRRPKPPAYNAPLSRLPVWMNVCLVLIMYCVLASNVASYLNWKQATHYLPVGGLLYVMLESMRIEQNWDMFSKPYSNDGWYETTGLLRGNTTVDLMGWGGPVPRKFRFHIASDYTNPSLMPQAHYGKDKPARFSRRFASQRWRKFIGTLRWDRGAKYRMGYGKYLCNAWNGVGYVVNEWDSGQLLSFELRFHAEPMMCGKSEDDSEFEVGAEEDDRIGNIRNSLRTAMTCTSAAETILWNHKCF